MDWLGPLWQMDGGSTNMRKVTKEGKVNGSGLSYALAKVGTMILNVVHVVPK